MCGWCGHGVRVVYGPRRVCGSASYDLGVDAFVMCVPPGWVYVRLMTYV